MFQNKSMPIVGKCQSKVFMFTIMRNDIFSPDNDSSKETSAMIGKMTVISF